jgi:hypothetical protein
MMIIYIIDLEIVLIIEPMVHIYSDLSLLIEPTVHIY